MFKNIIIVRCLHELQQQLCLAGSYGQPSVAQNDFKNLITTPETDLDFQNWLGLRLLDLITTSKAQIQNLITTQKLISWLQKLITSSKIDNDFKNWSRLISF